MWSWERSRRRRACEAHNCLCQEASDVLAEARKEGISNVYVSAVLLRCLSIHILAPPPLPLVITLQRRRTYAKQSLNCYANCCQLHGNAFVRLNKHNKKDHPHARTTSRKVLNNYTDLHVICNWICDDASRPFKILGNTFLEQMSFSHVFQVIPIFKFI